MGDFVETMHPAVAGHKELKHTRIGPLVLTLFGTLFLASVDNQLLIPLLPTLSQELEVSVGELGLLFSIYALFAGSFNLMLGPMTDRFGRVPFLRAALVGFAFLAAATARADSFAMLLGLRAATGIAAGLLSTCTASFIGDYFPYQRRGRVMGLVLSAYFAALIIGIPLSAAVAQLWAWRMVFVFSCGTAFLLVLCSFLFFPRITPRELQAGRGEIGQSYRNLLLEPATRSALAVSFLVSGGTLAFFTFISGYLNASFGLRPVEISWVFVIGGVAALAASPFSGWLSDHWTKRKVFLLANGLLVFLLLLLNQFGWNWLLFGVLFLISLCVAFRQTALQTLQTELVATRRRGTFFALRNCASQLGIAVSVFFAGLLYNTHGYAAVTLLAAGLTLLGGVVFYLRVSEPGLDSPTAGSSVRN